MTKENGHSEFEAQIVALLVVPGVQLVDIAGPLDVFDAANRLLGTMVYDLRILSVDGGPLACGNGMRLETQPSSAIDQVDLLVVPGSFENEPALTEAALTREIRRLARAPTRVVSVCNGAFGLAEAGLLNGMTVSTHWSQCARLDAAYDDVAVDPDRLHSRTGRFFTSGGATAGNDLALELVALDHGPGLARLVAKWLVMFRHRPGGQLQFAAESNHVGASASSAVREACTLIADDPGADHRVGTLARTVGLSPRHFARVFLAETGRNVGKHVRGVRIGYATSMLESTAADLETIARRSGFSSAELLRQAFQREFKITPGQYRERFADRPTQ